MSCVVCNQGTEMLCALHARIRLSGYITMLEAMPDGTRLPRVLHLDAHLWPRLYPKLPPPDGGIGWISTEAVDYFARCLTTESEKAS